MSRLIWNIYRKLKKSPCLFRLLVFLQALKINTFVRRILQFFDDNRLRQNPSQGMKEAVIFFENNDVRVQSNRALLADEESRMVYDALIAYRTKREPIPKSCYSFKNQYFPEDILKMGGGIRNLCGRRCIYRRYHMRIS